MEKVEKEAGKVTPVLNREPAREVGSDGIRKKGSSSGWLAKQKAKRLLRRQQQQQ